MDHFKLASREGLRFQTSKGLLNVEQLWTLKLPELNDLAVTLQEEYEKSGKKTFLEKKTPKDRTTKLKFEVVYDILMTLKEESDLALVKRENKESNEKIIAMIAEKQDESLKGLSIKELEKLLK